MALTTTIRPRCGLRSTTCCNDGSLPSRQKALAGSSETHSILPAHKARPERSVVKHNAANGALVSQAAQLTKTCGNSPQLAAAALRNDI